MWVCRLPVHIGHAERAVFYETLRRIRDFPMGRQSRRPLRKGFNRFPYLVGADDSVRPRDAPLFTGICGESVLPCNFECKADLPHPFKGTDSQVQLFRNRRRVSKRS